MFQPKKPESILARHVVNKPPSPAFSKYELISNKYINSNHKYLDTISEPNDEQEKLSQSGPLLLKRE